MKKIKIFFLSLAATALAASAQDNNNYSMYGYGILSDRATSMQRQMGSVGYAMSSGRQINVMNPASYAAIDSLTFLFDMGADISLLWQKEGKAREHTTGGGLDYVTMQFPITKYLGASIGMLPYSSVGYAFGNDIKFGAVQNQGSGGINQAYVGLGGKFKGFSLGVNVAYSFGNIINDVYATPSSVGQALIEHVMQIRDWDIVIGAQYTHRINKNDDVTVGVTYTPKKSLHGDTWVTTQENTATGVTADTVASMKMNGHYYTPNTVGAGVSYRHERVSRWMVEADVTFQEWSKAAYSPLYRKGTAQTPENVVFQGMQFNDRTRYALGGEFVPKVRGNYLQRIAYRAGLYMANDYLNINGNKLKEYGVTAGFGFNTPEGKTMINLGFEWKHRKGHPMSMITQNFFNITLGINVDELWFWQRRIK